MSTITLTDSLEDYLETIYRLVQAQRFARVKEIAQARDVRAASVSNALKKLAELGLIHYERREYVTLTNAGEREGRKVYARHRLLTRFFVEVLNVPPNEAEEQACAMEHSLSDEVMDRMVRFFEFLGTCPSAPHDLLEKFSRCPIVHEDAPECRHLEEAQPACHHHCKSAHAGDEAGRGDTMSISQMASGEAGRVTQIDAQGAIRQRLLDMGILPDTRIAVERKGPTGDPVWIKVQGAQLALRRHEADAVRVSRA